MIHADLSNLLRCRPERDALLRRGTAFCRLQRNAAETVGIADRRGRDSRLPTAIEEILRRATMPLKRAAGHLLHDTIARQLFFRPLDELLELQRIVMHRIPFIILIRVDGRTA